MALLSIDAEYRRAREVAPFSNGFEGESWMANWCENGCVHLRYCPLIMVAMLDFTPQAWVDERPGHLNRYDCAEFNDGKENEVQGQGTA